VFNHRSNYRRSTQKWPRWRPAEASPVNIPWVESPVYRRPKPIQLPKNPWDHNYLLEIPTLTHCILRYQRESTAKTESGTLLDKEDGYRSNKEAMGDSFYGAVVGNCKQVGWEPFAPNCGNFKWHIPETRIRPLAGCNSSLAQMDCKLTLNSTNIIGVTLCTLIQRGFTVKQAWKGIFRPGIHSILMRSLQRATFIQCPAITTFIKIWKIIIIIDGTLLTAPT
jgi:hypothetical protein